MKGGRLIVIVGVVLGLLAGIMVIMFVSQQSAQGDAAPTPEPPAVVRAVQNITKGDEIPLGAVQLLRLEPGEPAPPGAVKDPMAVAGMTAAVDIPQGTIIQEEMFFDKAAMVVAGESASRLFQPGRVAMAFPIGPLSGVAGALSQGDRVDIIASVEVIDVDQDTQIELPLDGQGAQLSRTAVQLTLQNIEVLRVGAWGSPSSGVAAQAEQGNNKPAAATTDMVTLLVPQQDALVLEFLIDKMEQGQARVTMALRSEDDQEVVTTEAVTLDYMMKRFGIPVPAKRQETLDEIETRANIEAR
ncbi:MAG: Flp pilus assembly protein CpaB [Anaerolineae bacterium]